MSRRLRERVRSPSSITRDVFAPWPIASHWSFDHGRGGTEVLARHPPAVPARASVHCVNCGGAESLIETSCSAARKEPSPARVPTRGRSKPPARRLFLDESATCHDDQVQLLRFLDRGGSARAARRRRVQSSLRPSVFTTKFARRFREDLFFKLSVVSAAPHRCASGGGTFRDCSPFIKRQRDSVCGLPPCGQTGT